MKLLLLACLFSVSAFASHQRMTVSFRFKGQAMKATFFTSVWSAFQDVEESDEYRRVTSYADAKRIEHYANREDLTAEEKWDLEVNLFAWERLAHHDEIMIVHKGDSLNDGDPKSKLPLGIGNIVGMIAVDRLGDTMMDCLPGYNLRTYEDLLLEKRLAPLGIKIPRPVPSPYIGPSIPKGIFKHWQPHIAEHFFLHQNLVWGDVIQANALFAEEGTWPLIHSLANGYGLFSTGRIIPANKKKIVEGYEFIGPKVFVPTLVVWEVFNKMKDRKIKKGGRTKYYENSGASPLVLQSLAGRVDQWHDPRLAPGNYVQVMHKTGDEFRHGWTEHFVKREGFSFVRDVKIDGTWLESTDGKKLISHHVPQWASEIAHHPHELGVCINDLLVARQTPTAQVTIPVTIGVSLGNSKPVTTQFNIPAAMPWPPKPQ